MIIRIVDVGPAVSCSDVGLRWWGMGALGDLLLVSRGVPNNSNSLFGGRQFGGFQLGMGGADIGGGR